MIGASPRLATLQELQTIYGAEDLYDMLEVLQVDGFNRRLAAKENKDGW